MNWTIRLMQRSADDCPKSCRPAGQLTRFCMRLLNGMNCPRCGSATPAGATFCLQCGQMFVAAGPGGALVAKKQRNAGLLSIAVGAGVLALFGGLAASG